MNRTTARALWWAGTILLMVAAFIGLDRLAWVDGLPEVTQILVRMVAAAIIFAVAGELAPRPREAEQAPAEE